MTRLEEQAALVHSRLPAGVPVAVIGSTSFWHEDSERTCAGIGERLARLDGLVLLTGGVAGVGASIGRSYFTACRARGRTPAVIHVLPRGCAECEYGTTLFAGDEMDERREVLGRLARTVVVVEGGPGTVHEASVAARNGAMLVPVGRSGGHAGALYRSLTRTPFVAPAAWETLGNAAATSVAVAATVAEIVESRVRVEGRQ